MKKENNIIQNEWLEYAKDDLESAKIILKETDNYHISVYHSHQAVEKILKWFMLKNEVKYPFTHDLKVLFKKACEIRKTISSLLDDILFVDNLYPQLRYPTGEKISKHEAEKSFTIAKETFKTISGQNKEK